VLKWDPNVRYPKEIVYFIINSAEYEIETRLEIRCAIRALKLLTLPIYEKYELQK